MQHCLHVYRGHRGTLWTTDQDPAALLMGDDCTVSMTCWWSGDGCASTRLRKFVLSLRPALRGLDTRGLSSVAKSSCVYSRFAPRSVATIALSHRTVIGFRSVPVCM